MPAKRKTVKRATKSKTAARKTTRKVTAKSATKRTAKKATAKRSTAKRTTVKRATAKSATAKRAPAKRVTAKRAAVKKPVIRKLTAIKDPMTKTNILRNIAESTGLTKPQVNLVFDELNDLFERHLKKGGAGMFNFIGLLKCEVKRKPATKARKGINPFTGEEIMFKAKPARKVVKVKPLKKLKEMVD